MPSDSRRPRKLSPTLAVVAVAALTLFGMLLASRPVMSQAARPSKKDSSPRTKPKEVVLTPSLSPAEVRPGDTVVYKVAARLDPGWHIYTYTKEAQNDGPRQTRFDLFDTGGLTVDGEWAASKAPIRKKEPAFPEIDALSFFEDEVTWSLRLKVPADAPPGKKTIRCQASYQICNAASCKFPGAWTLPEVSLTVLGGAEPRANAEAPPAPAGPRSKKADTAERLRPKSVTLSASVKPDQVKPGGTVALSVTARLQPGWHIYDAARQQPDEGPRNTVIDVFDTAGLKAVGDWKSETAPQVKAEEAFNGMLVSSFEGEVTWTLSMTVPARITPGEKTLRCQVEYQVCDQNSCLPPARTSLEVALNVLPGEAAVASAPPPAAAPEAPAKKIEPAAEQAKNKKVVTEVEERAREGIIPLMIASAFGGLLALLMPCVWPMVPITVNFFVKQGQAKNGSPTALAVTYCLAIIGLFTTIGVFCSFFVSATALPRLANNPWLNFAVAGLFFAFGLSLLGLFEIRLPNALLNASSQGESRGGLIGVGFMALTLTITSFTCTFPVVGGLLVMASTGQFFYPIIGLATFATVLAFPFFLLALSPGLLSKVPKSGDWMNAVKVVGGLVELGAAFKFLNTAEIAFVTPENAWIDAQFVLTAWIILAAVCGFYLLGFFRTDHDLDDIKVGPGRMILGASFLGIALFLTPALFGRPPQSQIWDRLVIGILPPDAGSDFRRESPTMLASGESRETKATDTDPAKAERQEKTFHGVAWGLSYEAAVERSKAVGKPILIDFTGVNCANCRLMEQRVLPRPEVAALLGRFVTVKLYTDFVPIASITADQREELARKNQERELELGNDTTNPLYVVISPDGQVLGTTGGYREPEVFVDFLTRSLGKLKVAAEGKVAQAEGAR